MQSLTNLGSLPARQRFMFFAGFLKVTGGEGAPARYFAVLD
jgi:kynurenine formamidase